MKNHFEEVLTDFMKTYDVELQSSKGRRFFRIVDVLSIVLIGIIILAYCI